MSDGLNERQLRFCREYLNHGNGTRAAINAGYARSSASSTASEMLSKNEKVRKFIEDSKSGTIKPSASSGESAFDLKRAIEELENIQSDAEREGNHANALRSIELKAKLMGLLKDTTPTNNGFQINIVGIEVKEEPAS